MALRNMSTFHINMPLFCESLVNKSLVITPPAIKIQGQRESFTKASGLKVKLQRAIPDAIN